MSFISHVVGQTRVFDPIYDPLFIVSSTKDAWRANATSLSKSAPIHVLTNYSLMFSDCPKEQRTILWKQQNFLPHFRIRAGLDGQGQVFSEKNVLSRYRGCFFHHTPGNGTIVNLKIDLPDLNDEAGKISQPICRNIGCQTKYRESSAQTRPYQPEIVTVNQNQDLEILRINKLITGEDQPNEFEAKVVERARRRREWEKSLPPPHSEKDQKQRFIILQAFEWEEWLAREEEIEVVQNTRLQLVVRLLERRDQCFKLSSIMKLENTTKRIEQNRKRQLAKLNHKFDRDLRKLEIKHLNLPRKYKKEDIVEEHINKASELYGPQMRYGDNPSRGHYVEFRKKFDARLDKLDRKVNLSKLVCPISKYDQLSKPKQPPKEIYPGFKTEQNLRNLYESLQMLREKKPELKKQTPLKSSKKTEMEIPPTPTGVDCDYDAEMNYQATVYFQKIIKGRAIQSFLLKSKEKYRSLIMEIRSTHTMTAVNDMFPERAQHVEKLKLASYKHHQKIEQIWGSERELKQVLNESEAAIVEELFDFFEKELSRLKEQRKIHALCMLAQNERLKREAHEAGNRQKENIRRREHSEIYRHVSKTSSDMINLYLENVLMEETDLKAQKDARQKIDTLVKSIHRKMSAGESTPSICNSSENETEVKNVINDFLRLEIQKQRARNRMEVRKQRHLLAAHKTLYEHIEEMYPKEKIDERPEIADAILTEVIHRAIDCEDVLTELSSNENLAHHEAMAAIRKIINRVLPEWKATEALSAESKVPSTSEPSKSYESKASNSHQEMLDKIVSEVHTDLWQQVYENIDGPSEDNAVQIRKGSNKILQEDTIGDTAHNSLIHKGHGLKLSSQTSNVFNKFDKIKSRGSSEEMINVTSMTQLSVKNDDKKEDDWRSTKSTENF